MPLFPARARASVSVGLARDTDSFRQIHSLGCKSRKRVKGARLPPLGRADGVLEVEFYPSMCIARRRVAGVADMEWRPCAVLALVLTTWSCPHRCHLVA
jgi:hypothetical protein